MATRADGPAMQSPTVGQVTPPRWRRPAQVAGAGLALIVAGLVGYTVAQGSPAAPAPAATTSPFGTTTDEAGTAPDATVHPQPAPPALPAPVVPAPPLKQLASFTGWRSGGGLDLVNGVTGDLATVTAADPAARQPLCATLGKDVDAAKAYAPMPDAAAQSAWSTALAHAGRANAACSANPTADVTADLRAATSALGTATERMSYFSGH